jgi:hypothetical protein
MSDNDFWITKIFKDSSFERHRFPDIPIVNHKPKIKMLSMRVRKKTLFTY